MGLVSIPDPPSSGEIVGGEGLDLRFCLAAGPLLSTRIGLLPFQTPLLALRSGVWIKDRWTAGPFVSIGCASFRLLVPNMPSHVPRTPLLAPRSGVWFTDSVWL